MTPSPGEESGPEGPYPWKKIRIPPGFGNPFLASSVPEGSHRAHTAVDLPGPAFGLQSPSMTALDREPIPAGISSTRAGKLELFGFPTTKAQVRVLPRTTAWRAGGAILFGVCSLLLAPLVGLVPPHAPWALGALGMGGFLALRRWRERFTILALEGLCPKCGGALGLREGTPLKAVISVPCEGCHHDARLVVGMAGSP
jgi:hypothetical protein